MTCGILKAWVLNKFGVVVDGRAWHNLIYDLVGVLSVAFSTALPILPSFRANLVVLHNKIEDVPPIASLQGGDSVTINIFDLDRFFAMQRGRSGHYRNLQDPLLYDAQVHQ